MTDTTNSQTEGQLDELEILVMAEDSVMYESPCLGQHGISLLLKATGGEVTKNIMPGHCTGFRAQAAMYAAFGTAFTPLQTGMRIKVSSSFQEPDR